jgi:hypothetical protein
MAVLSRVSFSSQQRLDLQHVVAEQSFQAADFRYLLSIFNGIDKNYVVRGLEILPSTDLTVSVVVSNCMILSPLDGATSFYVGLPNDLPETLLLPQDSTVYVEGYFERVSSHPVTTAQWDPGAITAQNPDGTEFTSSVNFEEYVDFKLRYNTAGFTESAIKIAKIQTNASNKTTVVDSRELFYRLATGGASPDFSHRYPWSSTRGESSVIGTAGEIGELNISNPYYSQDQTGARNDKAINSLKLWMDAVMTIIAEIKGTPYWYSTVSQFIGKNLFFDSINGSSCIPKDGLTLDWDASTRIVRTVGTGPMSWAFNAGHLQWHLGGTFTSGTRAYSNSLFNLVLPATPSGLVLALKLERETTPATANEANIEWFTISVAGVSPDQCVKGSTNDFTGIAVGDYIRKYTDSYFKYYKVIAIDDGTSADYTNGAIATYLHTGLVLEPKASGEVRIPSSEKYVWFRSAYSQEDLFYTYGSDINFFTNGSLILAGDEADLYFMGRRNGSVFDWRVDLTVEKTNVKVVKSVTTASFSDPADTVINHGFLLGDRNFTWSAIESSTGRLVHLDGNQTTTGVTLKRTFEPLIVDVTFVRTPYVRN